MKVAFLHYHLKTGGVTSVLHRQAECIQPDCDILFISGAPADPAISFPISVIESIGYDHPDQTGPAPERIAAEIDQAVRSHFSGPCDVLHVHNPLLAKNRSLLRVLQALQKRNYRLLLQVHDFAEDGRPHLYYPESYPADCHYAVINSRDYAALLKAGATPQGVHLLPNMVTVPGSADSQSTPSDLILYPIRAIRRKNIGEAILLSLFFTRGEKLAITLPPNSPVDFPSYEGWKQFVAQWQLNIEFEAGLHSRFSDLVTSCRSMITTSIMEGFGFVYLEPWLAGKLLWGRSLPDICRDFIQNGIGLKHMYGALNVPLSWIDENKYRSDWKACVIDVSNRFHLQTDDDDLEKALGRITADGQIDFGLLGEKYQHEVIGRVLNQRSARPQLTAANPWLVAPSDLAPDDDLIAANRQAVEAHYGRSMIRDTLLKTYRKVARKTVHQRIDKNKLLSIFFDLPRFSLLKWGSYVR